MQMEGPGGEDSNTWWRGCQGVTAVPGVLPSSECILKALRSMCWHPTRLFPCAASPSEPGWMLDHTSTFITGRETRDKP